MRRAFIGVGSNIAPDRNIREALHRLAQFASITAISTFYRQPAVGRPNQPDFVNGVVAIEADRASNLAKVLRQIEKDLGRRRTADRYAARPIDLDLLLLDDDVAQHGALPLPHADILNRAFVAIPRCELAPSLVLPGCDILIADIAARFSPHTMQSLPEYTCRLRDELFPESHSFC
jgi:2-amino-4-hydroxy-6-hydroxymethyldihydropteridine diphosphokinase